jgi:hypothetical protein
MDIHRGNGKGTATDPAAQFWVAGEQPTGLRLWGTNVEHHFPLPRFDRIWIGKDPATTEPQIWIDHETVSRRHATIEWRGPHLVVVDQGSKNGTKCAGVPQAIFELRPGQIVSFGSMNAVAFSPRTQRIRSGLQRFLGYGDGAQWTVDTLQLAALARRHIALVAPPGSGARALARFIHDTAPSSAWPFKIADVLPTADNLAGQRNLVSSAALGSLVLDVTEKSARAAAQLTRAFDLIADNSFNVRLIVIAPPGLVVEQLVGARIREVLDVVTLPALGERIAEVRQLIADVARALSVAQGAPGDVLHADDYAQLEALATPDTTRRGRAQIDTYDELEDVTSRLVAVRKASSANEAERQLGLSRGALSKWASKYGFLLGAPGRPRRA